MGKQVKPKEEKPVELQRVYSTDLSFLPVADKGKVSLLLDHIRLLQSIAKNLEFQAANVKGEVLILYNLTEDRSRSIKKVREQIKTIESIGQDALRKLLIIEKQTLRILDKIKAETK